MGYRELRRLVRVIHAREYRVPLVVATGGTEILPVGQFVMVDGDKGIVFVHA